MQEYSESMLAEQHWDLGGLSMRPVVEMIEPFETPAEMFADFSSSEFEKHIDWLAPRFYSPEQNKLILSVHSWLVRTRDHWILIDTCVGCHKSDDWRPAWSQRDDQSWLRRLKANGVDPAQIDYVFCTHLHLDHCGWHTILVDGRWQPTFPNARYLFSRVEFEHARDNPDSVFEENVLPIVNSGLADIVESDHVLNDQVRLISIPGHTPGHVAVELEGDRGLAVMWGDLVHSPVQIREPEWASAYDSDPEQACESRLWMLQRYGDGKSLILTAHFPPPSAIHVRGREIEWNHWRGLE